LAESASFAIAYINGAVFLIISVLPLNMPLSYSLVFFVIASVTLASAEEKPEQPPYTILSKTSVYEIRQYDQQLWAQVEYNLPKGTDFSAGGALGFWPLFLFITGANNRQQQIPMTAPVASQLLASSVPATQIRRMAFIMPHSIFRTLDSVPTPTNAEVKLVSVDDVKPFACITFNMDMTNARIQENEATLRQAAATDGVKLVTDPEQIRYQGYDSPSTPLEKRTNDVCIPLV
jgi:hypothetical protein